MSSYIRVRLSQVQTILEDEITQHCMKSGANGLSEALIYSQPDLTYDPEILIRRTHDLDVYFNQQPSPEFFTGLQAIDSGIQWSLSEEQEKDWLEEWKKGFVPFKLAGPFWVVPSWIPSPVAQEHSITIDPGMAFGTGTHATTKMASYFVHKLCSKPDRAKNLSLIDVGTGTGILAMLAALNGVEKIVGIEIDPEARRVARENIALNHLEQIEIPDLLIDEVKEKFDVVVANIIDGVLIQIRPSLLKLMKPGAQLFLTGILVEREEHFFANFIEDSGLSVIRRIEQEEWVGYWVQA